MANYEGKSTKEQELIIRFDEQQLRTNKNGEPNGAFIVAQKNQSMLTKADTAAGKGDTNTNLVSTPGKPDENGKPRANHSIYITEKQLQTIIEAAGDNKITKKGVTFLGIKADLMPATDNNGKNIGLMPNTKTVTPSDYKLTDKTIVMQQNRTTEAINVRNEAKAHNKAQRFNTTIEAPVPEAKESASKTPEMA